jgi:hypothetical protein
MIDLGDFRAQAEVCQQWYAQPHSSPLWLSFRMRFADYIDRRPPVCRSVAVMPLPASVSYTSKVGLSAIHR